jgi:hypothetical protein
MVALLASAVLAFGLAGCNERPAPGVPASSSNTAVLGSQGPASQPGAPPSEITPLKDADGRIIPPPPLPADATGQVALTGPGTAWAVWVQGDRVVGARYTRAGGWEAPQPFERIAGQDSDPQLASNGQGTAMALWRHTVGRIESLRYSRYEASTGWSGPDVLRGALPRSRPAGLPPGQPHDASAPRLEMDADGHARAAWPSGFDAAQLQTSQYLRGRGWSPPLDAPLATAPPPATAAAR